jgi:hypothetical protein
MFCGSTKASGFGCAKAWRNWGGFRGKIQGSRRSAQVTQPSSQEHAYALDIDPTGNVLAFGTTTGSFWVSEDQGDRWQCVSEHLPPVFCVRFG